MDYFLSTNYSEKDFEILLKLLNIKDIYVKAVLNALIKEGAFNKVIDFVSYTYDKNKVKEVLQANLTDMPLYINEKDVSVYVNWRITIGK